MVETIRDEHSVSGDQSVFEIPKLLSKEELKYFSKIDGWRFSFAVLIEIFTIAITIWISERYWDPFLYLVATIIIGSRMHALAVLMHESVHYRAFSSRVINDIVGELLALPTSVTMYGFRNNHFAHHREMNTDRDPDWIRNSSNPDYHFPKSRWQIYTIIIQYIFVVKAFKLLNNINKVKHISAIPKRLKMLRTLFFISLLCASVMFDFWKQLFMYWLVPLFTTFVLFLYIRSIAEHFKVEYNNMLNSVRTVVAPFWERWLFVPYGINYHVEHHLYPSVPFFRLPELHEFLMKKEEYTKHAHITMGYVTGLFNELSAPA